jgi:hypothetical protein
VDADLDTLATALYVRTDDLLKACPEWAPWRPAIGIFPRISDAELVTLAVMQALLGFVSEARWLRYARGHLRHLFPYLPGQSGYNRRVRKLAATMCWLIRMLACDTSLWGSAARCALVPLQHTRDLLPECLDRAVQHRTPQSPHLDPDHDRPPVGGHIRQRPHVVPVHLAGQAAAPRARGRPARRPRHDHDHAVLVRHVLDDQRRQPGEHDSRKPIYVTPAPSCTPSPIVT